MNISIIIVTIMFCIYLVIVVDSQKSFSTLTCATTKRGPRIVGGSDATKGEMPFIVSLTRRGGHFCGATILNKNWIITAAHCVCNGLNNILRATHIKGVVGLHRISEFKKEDHANFSLGSPFEVSFKNITVHPNYDCTKPNDDIALLELDKPIAFTSHVKSICIANSDPLEEGSATVSGWGWTKENEEKGIRADILQKATVKVWNNEKCQNSFQKYGKRMTITKAQMCAGYEDGGIDSCWADSGGPLVGQNNILIGVVSTGVGCARAGLPGIYTRVSHYLKWIESVLSE